MSVTVAFDLDGLQSLADPQAVFEETAEWASHVGILSDEPAHAVTTFGRQKNIDIGFQSGHRSLAESLPVVRAQPECSADRYVLIGSDDSVRDQARAMGWAYLGVEDAAEAAGWSLSDEDEPDEKTTWL